MHEKRRGGGCLAFAPWLDRGGQEEEEEEARQLISDWRIAQRNALAHDAAHPALHKPHTHTTHHHHYTTAQWQGTSAARPTRTPLLRKLDQNFPLGLLLPSTPLDFPPVGAAGESPIHGPQPAPRTGVALSPTSPCCWLASRQAGPQTRRLGDDVSRGRHPPTPLSSFPGARGL